MHLPSFTMDGFALRDVRIDLSVEYDDLRIRVTARADLDADNPSLPARHGSKLLCESRLAR